MDKNPLVEKKKDNQQGGRAITQPYLNRFISRWVHPTGITGERWRQVVLNQPLAVVCRDTLISDLLYMEWAIVPKDADSSKASSRADIQYYTDLFETADGGFDAHTEKICQDMLTLPFGGMAEEIRENDKPDGRLLDYYHVDGATLYPDVNNTPYPVYQYAPWISPRLIPFPEYAINRVFMSPRPELRFNGWGMAPPEKIYMALDMIYRGDTYYAGLLLDTPEAGILDLMDMSKENAEEWLEGFRTMLGGIDGFKIPVLYEHETPAKFIPFNLPPLEMMLNATTAKYAQLVLAGYGLRLSDLGMSEMGGEKSLAGVIRGERQSKRSGRAVVQSKILNYYNRFLRDTGLKFIFIDNDSEQAATRNKSLAIATTSYSTLEQMKVISREEIREQIIADGYFTINMKPEDLPELEQGPMPGEQGARPSKPGQPDDEVPADQGGRGEGAIQKLAKMFTRAKKKPAKLSSPKLTRGMNKLIEAGLDRTMVDISDARLEKLVKVAVAEMYDSFASLLPDVSNDILKSLWLPNMIALAFHEETSFDEETELLLRARDEEVAAKIEELLAEENWWSMSNPAFKKSLTEFLTGFFTLGMEDMALDMARVLYNANIIDSPNLIGISFDLVNKDTLQQIQAAAGDLITNLNEGTRFYINRSIMAGVREGFSTPRIADMIRRGVDVEELLADQDFIDGIVDIVGDTLEKISKSRLNSIVNTEISRAENAGKFSQMEHNGLTTKKWHHLGKRGITAAGNEHPCPICTENQAVGFVPIDFEYVSVFKDEGPLHPPGHPGVDHCTIIFDEQELVGVVSQGEFIPWTGN